MIQTEAYSTDPGEYNPPGRTVHKYNDGIYFVIAEVRLRRGSFPAAVRADMTVRMWRLWGFDTAGLLGYVGDWLQAKPVCDIDGSGGVEVDDLFAFLTAWFNGG